MCVHVCSKWRSDGCLSCNLRDRNLLWAETLETMAFNVWRNLMVLTLSGFKPYLEAGAGWLAQVKQGMKMLLMVHNPMRQNEKTSPHVTHRIKMASVHLSMDDVSRTYKITPVRRL